ncbi:MAG: PAS domain S-box protein [Leptolyngbya sp.]|nr:PAS domain S-box protein [Candidatus Melainabacteria bacterium]
MQPKLKLSHQLLLLVIVPVVIELIIGGVMYAFVSQSAKDFKREEKFRLLVRKINEVRSDFLFAFQASNEYVMSHDLKYFKEQAVLTSTAKARNNLRIISDLIKDDAIGSKRLKLVSILAEQTKQNTDAFFLAWERNDEFGYLEAGARVKSLAGRMSEQLNILIQEQQDLQDKAAGEANEFRTFYGRLMLLFVAIPAILLLAFAFVISQRISSRFGILTDNAQRLAAGMPLNEPIAGGDEMAMLDMEFRRMSSELENALRKQRVIVDYAADVICSLNSSSVFSEVSTAASTMWGYSPEELVGMRFASIIFPDDLKHTINCLEEAQHHAIETFDNRVMRKDGALVDTRWSVRFVEQERSMVCVAHDVSQRKQLERMKQEFVAIVSHDLRSPLTSINLRLNTLASGMHGELPADANRIINNVTGSVKRLIGLINDLLDIEKLDSGSWDMRFRKESLLETFKNSAESVLALSESKRIKVILPEQDLMVNADHERLTQVITNIISNSIKFSPEDTEVVLSAESDGEWLEVRIKDNGPGILEEERATIFDRFKQSKREAGRKSGSGLGLAICASIIREHGGTIGVDSENGEGSTFWFRIPTNQTLPLA